jgi:octaprenyl-diphosphate synthase
MQTLESAGPASLSMKPEPWLQAKLDKVEEWLPLTLDGGRSELKQVGEAFVRTRGKRIRPAVAVLAARMMGYEGGDADVRLGVVVELIHLATLVHDDVLDEARMRRGERSVNFAWGNDLAVLFGDYLYTKSMDEAIKLGRIDVLETLCGITTDMIQGELAQHYSRGADGLNEDAHLDIVRRKTGLLFAGCAALGGRIAGVAKAQENRLWDFGLNFGVAFQLVDDLLDYTAKVEELGKPLLGDLAEGKLTLPFYYLTTDGNPRLAALLRETLGKPDAVMAHQKDILSMAVQSSGIARARRRAEGYAALALDALSGFPEGGARSTLEGLTRYILNRKK